MLAFWYKTFQQAAAGAGFLAWCAARGPRRRMTAQFAALFPRKNRDEIALILRRFFRSLFLNKLDVFFYPLLNPRNIGAITEIQGEEHLRRALDQGRGVVLMHGHLGNPQMLIVAVGHRGYKLHQVGLAPDDVLERIDGMAGERRGPVFRLWMRFKQVVERCMPADFIYVGKDSLRQIYDALKRNEVIAMSADGVHGGGVLWDFMGRQTVDFLTGPVRVALKSRAVLLPAFALQLENGRHRLVIEPPMDLGTLPAGGDGDPIRAGTQAFVNILERHFCERPWLYARYFGLHPHRSFFLEPGQAPGRPPPPPPGGLRFWIRWAALHVYELFRWFYWWPLRLLVQVIPRTVSYGFASVAGRFLCAFQRGKRDRVRRWLFSLPPVEGRACTERDVLDTFIHYAKSSIDTLRYGRLNPSNIEQMVRFEGAERLDAALAAGKGVLVFHPHLGNEELLMPALGHKGYPTHQVASRFEPERLPGRLFALVNLIRYKAYQNRIRTRERLPVRFLYIDHSIRDAFRVLRNNGLILLAVDGREGRGWIDLEYLGRTASISTGPMKLALATGATVVPTFIVRTGLFQHTLTVLPAFSLERTGDEEQDVIRNTRAVLAVLEPHIRAHASQYAKFELFGIKIFKEKTS